MPCQMMTTKSEQTVRTRLQSARRLFLLSEYDLRLRGRFSMEKPSKIKTGYCHLTGDIGPFSKSHIIPDAFIRRATDAPFKEWDGTGRPKRLQMGWYDTAILGARGEAVLAKYDDAAAKCFIKNGFTYRTRRDPLDAAILTDRFVPGQIYEISNVDAGVLHLFALSLLWRASVSTIPAFSRVNVRPTRLEEIRLRLLAGDPGSPDEFPAYFSVFCGAEIGRAHV